MTLFTDRSQAGQELSRLLMKYRNEDVVVMALPRGGLPVASEVAKSLEAPLDIVMVRKIGAPRQPELALAAVVDGSKPEIVINEEVAAETLASADYLQQAVEQELKEIERRRTLYFGHGHRQPVAGRSIIIVDDGIATGATMRAAVHAVRRAGAVHIIVAAPVASSSAMAELRHEADEVVCIEGSLQLGSVGAYYGAFPQLTDEDVIATLDAVQTSATPASRPHQ